ncbi:hypothetical protein GCM10010256_79980 [Streptomyces coeruleorubidus]|nr:hypothetical protein GCM10010256_79980 [Streptomyces coeruleorubidus]
MEESGFATQDAAAERWTEIYKAKKAAPRGRAKAERIARYGAMRFEEYAGEWRPASGIWVRPRWCTWSRC